MADRNEQSRQKEMEAWEEKQPRQPWKTLLPGLQAIEEITKNMNSVRQNQKQGKAKAEYFSYELDAPKGEQKV